MLWLLQRRNSLLWIDVYKRQEGYEAEITLNTKFKADKNMQKQVQEYLKVFEDEVGDVDFGLIKNMSLDLTAGTPEQIAAFQKMQILVGSYGLSVQDVVNWLIDQGVVTAQVTDETNAEAESLDLSLIHI